MGLSKVSIKLDCKQVIDDKIRRLNISFLFGAIIDICKVSLIFIMRQVNSVAHLLATTSLSYASSYIQDHIPSYIEIVIINKMS